MKRGLKWALGIFVGIVLLGWILQLADPEGTARRRAESEAPDHTAEVAAALKNEKTSTFMGHHYSAIPTKSGWIVRIEPAIGRSNEEVLRTARFVVDEFTGDDAGKATPTVRKDGIEVIAQQNTWSVVPLTNEGATLEGFIISKAFRFQPGVTLANYMRLKTGMGHGEVVEILGKAGIEMSSNEFAGTQTVMYKWDGDGGGFGANMNAIFQDNKLVQKAQFGLK